MAAAAAAVAKPKIVLHYGAGNLNSYALRIALAEKRLQVEERVAPYDVTKYGHVVPEPFKHLDPRRPNHFMGPVHGHPVLKVNGLTLNNARAAMLHLEEAIPEPSLLPADAPRRLHALELFHDIADFDGELRAVVAGASANGGQVKPGAADELRAEVASFDRAVQLGHVGRDAGAFTLADCALLPRLLLLQLMGAGLERFPALLGYVTSLAARESVAGARPAHWAPKPTGAGMLAGVM